MTTAEILTIIQNGWVGWLALVMTLIQIAPIKINPWTFLLKLIGKAMNGEIIKQMENLREEFVKLKSEIDEDKANACRTRILRFNDELMHDVHHSKEHFDQTLIDITTYENYCETHKGYKNNIAAMAIERIKNTYEQCVKDGSFL